MKIVEGRITDIKGEHVGKWFYNYNQLSFYTTSDTLRSVLLSLKRIGVVTGYGIISFSIASPNEILNNLVANGFYAYPLNSTDKVDNPSATNDLLSWQYPRVYLVDSTTSEIVAYLFFQRQGLVPILYTKPEIAKMFEDILKNGIESTGETEAIFSDNGTVSKTLFNNVSAQEASYNDYSFYLSSQGYELVPCAYVENKENILK